MQMYSNMSNYTVIRSNDHLAHYGVLGMKWGVRKDRSSSGRTKVAVGRHSRPTTKREKRKIKVGYSNHNVPYLITPRALKRAQKNSKIKATNFYRNPIKMTKKVNAKIKLYNIETKQQLKNAKSIGDRWVIAWNRNKNSPAIGMLGAETTLGKAMIESLTSGLANISSDFRKSAYGTSDMKEIFKKAPKS